MKKKHLFRALLALFLVAVLAVGGWVLDFHLNGGRLPISHESVQEIKIEMDSPERINALFLVVEDEKTSVTLDGSDPADQEKVEAVFTLLREFRYVLADRDGSFRFGSNDPLFYIDIVYAHHKENYTIYDDKITCWNTLSVPYFSAKYLAKDSSKCLEQNARFALTVFGRKDN